MNAKKPLHYAHEVDFAAFGQQTAEESFDRRILGEVDEVIDIETKSERWGRFLGGRVRRIPNEAGVEARIFERRGEANRDKECIDFIILVTGAPPKAIQSFQQKPIFVRISIGVARGWTNYSNFFRRKDALGAPFSRRA